MSALPNLLAHVEALARRGEADVAEVERAPAGRVLHREHNGRARPLRRQVRLEHGPGDLSGLLCRLDAHGEHATAGP